MFFINGLTYVLGQKLRCYFIALSDFSKAFSPKCLILDEILTSNNCGDGLCSFGRKRPKFEYIIGCIGTKFSGYANSKSHRNSGVQWKKYFVWVSWSATWSLALSSIAGFSELDRGRSFRAKCKSLSKPTWNHHERGQNNSVENVFQRFYYAFKVLT